MTHLFEGMILIDNDAVRAGWKTAKATATGLIEKHGGKIHTARRWDECKLAYTIKRKNRATFLLTHYEIENEGIEPMLRDLELNETVLRYLLLSTDEVPEEERTLTLAEDDDGFDVPEPPADDHVDTPILVEFDEDGERIEIPRAKLEAAAAAAAAAAEAAASKPTESAAKKAEGEPAAAASTEKGPAEAAPAAAAPAEKPADDKAETATAEAAAEEKKEG